jgi:glycosyltransferase involved in cell wall biosynthesis
VRILWVKPVLPYPPTQGTRRLTLGLLEALGGEHEITFVTRLLDRDEARWIPEVARLCHEVVAELTPNRRSSLHRVLYKARAVLGAARGVSPRAFYTVTPSIRRTFAERAPGCDLAVIEYWYMGDLAPLVPRGRRVLLAHDADCVVFERALALARTPLERARARWVLAREAAAERAAWGRFDTILTLTSEDRETVVRNLEGARRPRVEILPVPVDTDRLAPRRTEGEEGLVVFVGTFAADFNVDAATHFARDVFPFIRREEPGARLELAGGEAPAAVRALGGLPGVSCLGHVEDLPALVSRARAFVVPLRFGGGIRIRILEAMAMAAPIVTSRVGLGEIPLRDGKECLIADGEAETARAVVALLRDPSLGRRLGAAAREVALRDYSRERVAERVRAMFRELGRGADGRTGGER